MGNDNLAKRAEAAEERAAHWLKMCIETDRLNKEITVIMDELVDVTKSLADLVEETLHEIKNALVFAGIMALLGFAGGIFASDATVDLTRAAYIAVLVAAVMLIIIHWRFGSEEVGDKSDGG